jgi:hypothetical protein
MLEILPRPHFPRPHPRPFPRHGGGRYYGGYYPTYQEPVIIEVERTTFEMIWRVTNTTSWGTNVVYKSRDEISARRFFDRYKPMGFNNGVALQQFTGSGWMTVAQRSVTNGR